MVTAFGLLIVQWWKQMINTKDIAMEQGDARGKDTVKGA
jgi:hypothetical protein